MNIEDLISQYIDGSLPSEAEAELHHRLAVSPEARRLFRAHIMLKGVARDQRVLHVPTPAMRSSLFERLAREEGMKLQEPASEQVAVVEIPARDGAQDELPRLSTPGGGTPRSIPSSTLRGDTSRRRRRMLPWLIPIVMAGLMIGVLWNVGERDERNAGTMAGRNVEELPPAPGERGGDMVNPSSPQAGVSSDAAPRSDRDDVAPRSDAGETSATANGRGDETRSGAVGSVAQGRFDASVEESDAAGGTDDKANSLALSAPERSVRENDRVEALADRPSSAQNMGPTVTRRADRRRADTRDAESRTSRQNEPPRDRHYAARPPASLGNAVANSPANAADAEMSQESLRAKEDQGGGARLQPRDGMALGDMAANNPVTTSSATNRTDTTSARWFGAFSDGSSERIAMENERYGNALRDRPLEEDMSAPSRTMASASESKVESATNMPESEIVVQREGATPTESKTAKHKSIAPPLVSSTGVEGSDKKESLASVPSNQMLAAAPPPAAPPPAAPPAAPMIALDSSGQSVEKSANGMSIRGSRKVESMSSSHDAPLDAAPSSQTGYVAGLEQRSMIDLESSAVTLQVIARGGVELGNVHQIYLLLGGENDRQDGLEVFGGGGYRYMLLVSRNWNVALGGWTGAGKRYFRSGVEIPVIYKISRVIRIELIPTLHYTRRIDGAAVPGESGRVTPGVGVGAGVTW